MQRQTFWYTTFHGKKYCNVKRNQRQVQAEL